MTRFEAGFRAAAAAGFALAPGTFFALLPGAFIALAPEPFFALLPEDFFVELPAAFVAFRVEAFFAESPAVFFALLPLAEARVAVALGPVTAGVASRVARTRPLEPFRGEGASRPEVALTGAEALEVAFPLDARGARTSRVVAGEVWVRR